jgi:hypothetical protein
MPGRNKVVVDESVQGLPNKSHGILTSDQTIKFKVAHTTSKCLILPRLTGCRDPGIVKRCVFLVCLALCAVRQ